LSEAGNDAGACETSIASTATKILLVADQEVDCLRKARRSVSSHLSARLL
jgi:Flp pilus assembly CpaE family ATPase